MAAVPRLGLALGIAGAAAAAGAIVAGGRRFDRLVADDVRALLEQRQRPHPPVATEAMLDPLPEPVRRHLRFAGVIGRPLVDTVRIRQEGRIKLGDRWFPFRATQWYTTDPAGFVWDATVSMFGLPVRGRDAYLGGRGLMRIEPAGLVPVVDAKGPEMDQGALVRHLSEMSWFPSSFLRENVRWEPIDDTSARATLAGDGTSVSGTFTFDAEGRLTEFRAERYRMVGRGFELARWFAPTVGYGTFEGLRLPVRGIATWALPGGDEPYGDIVLVEVTSDPPDGAR